MLKETGYQEKFLMLAPWMMEIVDVVKKDLRNEHLKIDRNFCKRYFLGKNLNQIELSEMCDAYQKDIAEGNVGLGEFIATRWLLKNGDIYGYFESSLKSITTDFEKLDVLPTDVSTALCEKSVKDFGAVRTYLFSVFNSVVFPSTVYEKLRERALKENKTVSEQAEKEHEIASLESLQKRHAREVASMQDRYEKKLNGMQKKYHSDVDALKKQIQTLKLKLIEKNG
jgi:hypothetical protein